MIDNVRSAPLSKPLLSPGMIAHPQAQVVLLITGTLHERDTHDLLERCHPLGKFETMATLCVATNVEELYTTVLVETPLGAFALPSLSGTREAAPNHSG